ncbi:TIGR03545 family protein [Arsukibacterium sp.]|uniref:TIGR03545 family protein n=1 Tax=Arsukibacterium sp. TaxID=1977258 RepID=UPI002FD987D6
MIRKSGWLIFISLTAAILALVYLLAGSLIRAGMVFSLEKTMGAEVNIDKVSLSLAPLALTIRELQVTDKANPSHNSVSFSQANAALELWPALLGYYVINDLTVEGLAFGTERRRQGKVYRGDLADEGDKIDLAAMLQLDLPDAEQLIARVNLQTLAKGEALAAQAKSQQQQLQQLRSQLPDQARLQELQQQISELTSSRIANPADLAAKAQQLSQLQDSVRTERDTLRAVQQQLQLSRQQLQQAVTELRDASAADWQQLQQLANLSDGGLAPLSQILLGDVWGQRIAQLESLYLLAKPYLPQDFSLSSSEQAEPGPVLANRILPLPRQPYPNVWIKQAQVHLLLGGGTASLAMHDLTTQHQLIDAASRFSLDVQQLPRLAAFKLQGDFAILEQMVTNLSWQLDGWQLQSMDIGRGDTLLTLAAGQLNSTGSLKLINNQINQQAQLVLQQAQFADSPNRYMQQLAGLLNGQRQIPLSLAASGLVSSPDVSVRSSLDSLIGDALMGEAKAKVAALQTDLRSQLDQRLQSQLGNQSDWLSLLEQQDTEAASLQDSIEQMLNAKMGNAKEEAKDRLLDRLRPRLGGG